MKILFRTSGGQARKKQLGFGHIYRCINLASHFKKNSLYFLIEDYGKVKKTLNRSGYTEVYLLRNNIKTSSDIHKTLQLVAKKRIDIVIVDKYHIKISYLKAVNKVARVVVVSDLLKKDYPADLLVNGFIGFKNKVFKNKYNTRCLLGPKYQILSKKCLKVKSKKGNFILVTFGGFDEHHVVELFLESVLDYLAKTRLKVILGPGTKKSKKIKLFEKKYGKRLTIVQKTENMCKEIAAAKFGIISGGITSYEFAKMKVPFAIICQYRHQFITANHWQKKGIATNLGLPNKNLPKKIRDLVRKIINEKFNNIPKRKFLLDGKGGKRISNEIIKLK